MTKVAHGLKQCLRIPSAIRPVFSLPDIATMSLHLSHVVNLMFCGESAKYSPHFCGYYSVLSPHLLSTGKCKIIDLSEENAFRREKIEFLARSAVDFMLDIADECIRQG